MRDVLIIYNYLVYEGREMLEAAAVFEINMGSKSTFGEVGLSCKM